VTERRKADSGVEVNLPVMEKINESSVYPQATAFATTKNLQNNI